MPDDEPRTVRKTLRAAATVAGERLAEIRNAAADLLKGLVPAPALQPVPVRVRPQRR